MGKFESFALFTTHGLAAAAATCTSKADVDDLCKAMTSRGLASNEVEAAEAIHRSLGALGDKKLEASVSKILGGLASGESSGRNHEST